MSVMPGSGEWLIILLVMLLLFGPSKLPKLGSALGQTIKSFRRGIASHGEESPSLTEQRRSSAD